MTTDDVDIDRRILLEAKSLIKEGHEVILLAANDGKRPRFEIIDSIKLERVTVDDNSFRHTILNNEIYKIPDRILISFLNDKFKWIPSLIRSFITKQILFCFRIKKLEEFRIKQGRKVIERAIEEASEPAKMPLTKQKTIKTEHNPAKTIFVNNTLNQHPKSYFEKVYTLLKNQYDFLNEDFIFIKPFARKIILYQILFLGLLKMFVKKLKRSPENYEDTNILCQKSLKSASKEFAFDRIKWDLLNAWEKALSLRALFYNPDIIHAHDLPQLGSAAEVARVLGCKLVYDAHEMYPFINTLTYDQSKHLELREKQLTRETDLIFTVNPVLSFFFSQHYKLEEPIVLRNSVAEDENFDATKRLKKLHHELNIPENNYILLYQGWISLTRGMGDLLRAIPLTQDNIHLVLIGYTSELEEIKKIIEPFKHRVHYIPRISWEKLKDYVMSADAGIIPYQANDLNHLVASPNKMFDFIYFSLPIIASNMPYISRIVDGEEFGITNLFLTPDDYAESINKMFSKENGGPQRFRKNLLSKRKKYLWQEDEKIFLDAYRKLIQSINYVHDDII
jgi:glycosyltransferase involved in cell wall biosynthesis